MSSKVIVAAPTLGEGDADAAGNGLKELRH